MPEVVADDTMLTRKGIVSLLQGAGIDVVAEAEDPDGLLRHVRQARPDVAIIDIRMPPTHTDAIFVEEHVDEPILVLGSVDIELRAGPRRRAAHLYIDEQNESVIEREAVRCGCCDARG